MFSLTELPQNQEEVGQILVKVQNDLRHLREQINNAVEGRTTDTLDFRELQKAVERTELGLKARTAEYVQSVNNHVLTLPSLEKTGSIAKKKSEVASPDEKPISFLKKPNGTKPKTSTVGLLQPLVVAKTTNKAAPNIPSPGQQNKDLRKLQILAKPEHPNARDVLSDKYGVALPLIQPGDKSETQTTKQKVVVGCTVEPLTTLPHANRIDPSKTPPPVLEEDAKKGILSLLERGLIPPAAELSLEPSPVYHQQAMLHPQKDQFSRSRAEPPDEFCGVGGYNISAVKVDVATALVAKETSLVKKKRKIPKDSAQGWTDNTIYRHLPREINAIVPFSAPVPTPSSDIKGSHNFVIQNGRTRSTSQDFIDFKRHYCLSWGCILTLIVKLEEILKNYTVPLAIIDGDRLADLALVFELEEKPKLEHFLTCIVNGEDVEKTIKTPGRRYLSAVDGDVMAAIKIQSSWRCFKDRKAYLKYREKQWAAGVIAISWIMNCKLTMIRKQLRRLRQTHVEKFKIRSKLLRSNWSKIKKSRRTIIHIPSLGYPQHVREGLDDLSLYENLQMARLCDLADSKVDVIYICPVELTDDVYQYYSKLLAMKANGDNEEKIDVENRYTIIVPDAVHHFPDHNMCLSTILKYSPKAIQRLKSLIKGKEAYIVPGVLHQDDLYIADILDLPILSADPEVASLYASKSGSKRIFLSANVEIPPSDVDIYSLPQLHNCLTQLVTENLHVKRWLFKMDNEFGGRGTAYCDVSPYLQCYDFALKESERYGEEKWSKRWAHEPTLNKIANEIPDILAKHATPVCKQQYATWEKYLEVFLQRGGIIEACPHTDSVTALTVDMVIEPDGVISILSTSDQIHAHSMYQCWGSSVPQSSVDTGILATKATAIATACRARDIIGYLSVDFVTFIEPNTMCQILWAVDLKLTHSDSLAQMKLMQYVSDGVFDAERNVFQVPVVVKPQEQPKTRRRKTIVHDEPPPSPLRYAIFSPRLQHSNLSVIHYSVFFQMCRAHGIGYDIKERAGTLFCLVDSAKREHLTMMVMSDDLQGSLSTFARNLSVIHQEISAPNMQGKSNFQAAVNDIDNILKTMEVNLNEVNDERKTPQLQAPKPKELQKILQEHQDNVRSHFNRSNNIIDVPRNATTSEVPEQQNANNKFNDEDIQG